MHIENRCYYITMKKPPEEDQPPYGLSCAVLINQEEIDANKHCLKALVDQRLEFIRVTMLEALKDKGYSVE